MRKEDRIIIGFSGKAGVGKTTAANWLVQTSGFNKISFADKLRELSLSFFPFTRNQLSGTEKDSKYEDYDWTPRQFLITLGDMVRFYDKDYFSKIVVDRIDGGVQRLVVIDDTRYPNEAEAIKRIGGYLVRIERNKKENPIKDNLDHPSEISLDSYKFDYVIPEYDNTTLASLYKSVLNITNSIKKCQDV